MTDLVPVEPMSAAPLAARTALPLDGLIRAWIAAKLRRSGSQRTAARYTEVIAHARTTLQALNIDLDHTDPLALAVALQGWAGQRWDGSDALPAGATINQRLAIVSSFYRYAQKLGALSGENPVMRIERSAIGRYAGAQPLPVAAVQARLTTPLSTTDAITRMLRDRALLLVGLTTGRRASELAGLRGQDVQVIGPQITVTFRRCKGGKKLTDTLTPQTARAIQRYLDATGRSAPLAADAPLWLSESPRNAGEAIGVDTIANICLAHLGTAKVHALRHTFTQMMIEAGAPIQLIQGKLGHDDLKTTSEYVRALVQAENPFASALDTLLGSA